MSEEKVSLQAQHEANRTTGCVVLAVGIAIVAFACFALIEVITILEGGLWFIPGDPSNFDPIASYAEVEAHAGENVYLTEIYARYVRRDGTMELTADYDPAPNITYEFYRLTGNRSAAPVGVISESAVGYREVNIRISEPFNMPFIGRDSGSWAFQPDPGMDRDVSSERTGEVSEGLRAPECHFSDLWTIAIAEEEANAEAVATIIYDEDGYHFRIQGTSVNLDFDFNCELVN